MREARRIERSHLELPALITEQERAKAAMGSERSRQFGEALHSYVRRKLPEVEAQIAREREARAADPWSGKPYVRDPDDLDD